MRRAVTYGLAGATTGVLLLGVGFGIVSPVRLHGGLPGPNTWLPTSTLKAQVNWSGWVREVDARLDGRAVPVTLDRDARVATLDAAHLADGPHDFKIVFHQAFFFHDREWGQRVFIASHPPQVRVTAPAAQAICAAGSVLVEGHADPDTRVAVGGQAAVDTGPTGRFSVTVPLREGSNDIAVVGTNRAGVERHLSRTVLCDLTPPRVAGVSPGDKSKIKTDRPTLQATVTDDGAGLARVTIQYDTRPAVELWHALAGAEPTHQLALHYHFPTLPEGLRTVHIQAEDRAGWKSDTASVFLVDSTEEFGDKTLTLGAVGRDVAIMQKHLVHQGFLEAGQVTSVFDQTTLAAVKSFQEEHHLKGDGVVGPSSIDLLSPRIVVDLARFSLVLLDGDEEIKRYTIACGQPAYPTPVGQFSVAEMVPNPPWIPPKGSLWAREAKTIPPGPGNPLGTRWIGLNSDVVGIHGTNADYSIGSASSHGCMRMHIADVEDLYRRVNVGTRVTILRGNEHSDLLHRLWPD